MRVCATFEAKWQKITQLGGGGRRNRPENGPSLLDLLKGIKVFSQDESPKRGIFPALCLIDFINLVDRSNLEDTQLLRSQRERRINKYVTLFSPEEYLGTLGFLVCVRRFVERRIRLFKKLECFFTSV